MSNASQPRRQYTFDQLRPGQRVRFELTADLDVNDSATANVRVWDVGTDDYLTTDLEITVYEVHGFLTGTTGQTGRAEWMTDAKRWEVYGCIGG